MYGTILRKAGLLAGTALLAAACMSPVRYIHLTGTVTGEYGTIVDRQKVIQSSKGAILSNESLRFGDPTYGITYNNDADGETYALSVVECGFQSDNQYASMLEALNAAIQEGTRVSITRRTDDPKKMVNTVCTDSLEVLVQ